MDSSLFLSEPLTVDERPVVGPIQGCASLRHPLPPQRERGWG